MVGLSWEGRIFPSLRAERSRTGRIIWNWSRHEKSSYKVWKECSYNRIFVATSETMAKTNPIGVRFDETILEKLQPMGYTTPQKVLSFLEQFWATNVQKIIEVNNIPKNKERILKERNNEQNGKVIPLQPKPIKNNYTDEETKKRIAELEAELKSPPKNPIIGLKAWVRVRENELKKLKQNAPGT